MQLALGIFFSFSQIVRLGEMQLCETRYFSFLTDALMYHEFVQRQRLNTIEELSDIV